MLFGANRECSLKARESAESQRRRKNRKYVSPKKGVYMKIVSETWSLHNRGTVSQAV